MIDLKVDQHSLLDLKAILIELDKPLGEIQTPDSVIESLSIEANSPFEVLSVDSRRDEVKSAIRDMMRQDGYKPTGRGKPASEYLIKAVSENRLGSINLVVDVCNVVSLHSGIPISVVDLGLCETSASDSLSVKVAPPESEYVFNATGQTIKLDGLLCLFDDQGPCANGVKDSQRTKTNANTTKVVALFWGSRELPDQAQKAASWFEELIGRSGAAQIKQLRAFQNL